VSGNTPSLLPTITPSEIPSWSATSHPTQNPSENPSRSTSNISSIAPSSKLSDSPTYDPTSKPTGNPSQLPSELPSYLLSFSPSHHPAQVFFTSSPTAYQTENMNLMLPGLPLSNSSFPIDTCHAWCYAREDLSWTTKCQYHIYCSGCSECALFIHTCDLNWCQSSLSPWTSKCARPRCAACRQCEKAHSFPVCHEQWCERIPGTWDEKCMNLRCSKCCDCEQKRKPPVCRRAWCEHNENCWEDKCNLQECSACEQCILWIISNCEIDICGDIDLSRNEEYETKKYQGCADYDCSGPRCLKGWCDEST